MLLSYPQFLQGEVSVGIARMERVALPYLRQPATWASLENGQQVIAIPKPGETVHVHTVVRTGSVHESDVNTGVSHFLEHLMFKGSARYPAGAFDRILEGVGGRVNANTAKDRTQYFVTLPKGDNGDYYRLALDLHADMLLHALLPEEEIGPPFDPDNPQVAEKRERMVVIEEIKMGNDNPWRQAMRRLNELIYPQHPYRRDVIGTAQVIATIPQSAIVDYYRTWYQPNSMVTIITGELDGEAVVDDVMRAFDFHAPLPVARPVFPPETPSAAPRREHLQMPLNVAYVVLGFLTPLSSDIRATIAFDVLSLVLGEGISSRMTQRLIEQLPGTPIFDLGSTHWTFRDNGNLLVYGIVKPEETARSFDLLSAEVQRLSAEPPDDAEIAKAVTRLEGQFAAQAETASGLSVGIADAMTRVDSPAAYTDYLPILRSLTRDDLQRYAAEFLAPARLCAVTVSPNAEGARA